MSNLILTKNNIAEVYERLTGHNLKLNCNAAFDAWDTYENMVIKDGGMWFNSMFYPIGQ